MAHLITATDSMMSVGETPWHGLGRVLKSAPLTWADAMREAGLDWTVRIQPAFVQMPDGSYIRIPGQCATVRDMADGRTLPIAGVGEDYTAYQNVTTGEITDAVVGSGRGSYETAGSLKGGRKVWALVKINAAFDVVKGDAIGSYLLLHNSHDGSTKASVRFSPVRVVCNNTLTAALAGSKAEFSVKHTTNIAERMEAGAEAMGIVRKQIAATTESYRALAGYSLTAERLASYILSVVPDNGGPKANHTRTENIRARILGLVESGMGSDIPGVRGSLWGAYNAITEYVDHERGIPQDSAGRITVAQADKRLESVWFGSGADLKASAMSKALALVG